LATVLDIRLLLDITGKCVEKNQIKENKGFSKTENGCKCTVPLSMNLCLLSSSELHGEPEPTATTQSA